MSTNRISDRVKIRHEGEVREVWSDDLPGLVAAGHVSASAKVKRGREWAAMSVLVPAQVRSKLPEDGIQVILKEGLAPTGPHSLVEVWAMWRTGKLGYTSLLWFEGAEEWVPAKNFDEAFREEARRPASGVHAEVCADHLVMFLGGALLALSMFLGGEWILAQQTLMHAGIMGLGAGFVGRQVRVYSGKRE